MLLHLTAVIDVNTLLGMEARSIHVHDVPWSNKQSARTHRVYQMFNLVSWHFIILSIYCRAGDKYVAHEENTQLMLIHEINCLLLWN